MGKQSGKKKKPVGAKSDTPNVKQNNKASENSPKSYDKDTAVFISMSKESKEEGNRLFQKRDYEGAMLKYEKALKLLPRNHIDVSYLRSNMAACYMQMGLTEYPRAIHECNLALEVTPKYSKALLKRARCYEALNRFDLALRDVNSVLKIEPKNLMATEIFERLKITIEKKRIDLVPIPEFVHENPPNLLKEKGKKKKNVDKSEKIEPEVEVEEEKKAEDKLVVEEKVSSNVVEEEPKRTVKLVFGDDIRCAQIPLNCSILKLREVIYERFPSLVAILIKYRDQEGDLVTITTDEELRWAETSAEKHGSVRLYIAEVSPEQDPFFGKIKVDLNHHHITENRHMKKDDCEEESEKKSFVCIDDWLIQFSQLFKNYVGFDSDSYLDLHEIGMKLYSDAMEETVTSEEAEELFNKAAERFQEMAALALFNWGNVHMSKARKKAHFNEDSSREFVLSQVKNAYNWAQKEYEIAGKRYEEALRIKPDFYEGILAKGQQQFEQAKLSWYYAIGTNIDLETWPSDEVIQLYNCAEENMEKGMQVWEEAEDKRLNEISGPNVVKNLLQKMGFNQLISNDLSADEAEEQASNMRSQINILWGTLLYERSIMEFKLGLPLWQESLEVAVEKFELAGASPTDIGVMIKNHCSNDTALEGVGFNIDEIVQAWNEMYEAKRWQSGVPSFRLEPLLRRRVSTLYRAFEHA